MVHSFNRPSYQDYPYKPAPKPNVPTGVRLPLADAPPKRPLKLGLDLKPPPPDETLERIRNYQSPTQQQKEKWNKARERQANFNRGNRRLAEQAEADDLKQLRSRRQAQQRSAERWKAQKGRNATVNRPKSLGSKDFHNQAPKSILGKKTYPSKVPQTRIPPATRTRGKRFPGIINSTLKWLDPELVCSAFGLCDPESKQKFPIPKPAPIKGGQVAGRQYWAVTVFEYDEMVFGEWRAQTQRGYYAYMTGKLRNLRYEQIPHGLRVYLTMNVDNPEGFPGTEYLIAGYQFHPSVTWKFKSFRVELEPSTDPPGTPPYPEQPSVPEDLEEGASFLFPPVERPPQIDNPPPDTLYPSQPTTESGTQTPPRTAPSLYPGQKGHPTDYPSAPPDGYPYPPSETNNDGSTKTNTNGETQTQTNPYPKPPRNPIPPSGEAPPTEPPSPPQEFLPPSNNPPQDPPPCPPHCVSPMVCRFQPIDICNQPCIVEINNKLNELLEPPDWLETIMDMLNQLQGGEDSGLQFVQVTVPIIGFTTDGVPIATSMQVPALQGTEDQIIAVFAELADLKLRQITDKTELQRIYQILGGDHWVDEETQEIKVTVLPEAMVKESRETAKIGSVEPEVGIVAKNLIDLIAAFQTPTYGRLGLHDLPGMVPETLLAYSDNQKPLTLQTYVDLFQWFIQQFDALVGKFPIEIEIEDVDPTTQGAQTKKIELPNISEALAEMYGLNITSATNSDISINFLMRLAAEIITTKNAALITQDYVKANASFLGYKGNPKKRKVDYAFDPTNLESLEKILNESSQYIMGWEEDDKDSLIDYLQRLMFSAGIIKAVFFRSSKQMNQMRDEMLRFVEDTNASDDAAWDRFKQEINNPDSQFNQGNNPQPHIRENYTPQPPQNNP
jgi:hypothetical protein